MSCLQVLKILVSRGRDFLSYRACAFGLDSPSSFADLAMALGFSVAAALALILIDLVLGWPFMIGWSGDHQESLKNLALRLWESFRRLCILGSSSLVVQQ